jgi:hypothetical protein
VDKSKPEYEYVEVRGESGVQEAAPVSCSDSLPGRFFEPISKRPPVIPDPEKRKAFFENLWRENARRFYAAQRNWPAHYMA